MDLTRYERQTLHGDDHDHRGLHVHLHGHHDRHDRDRRDHQRCFLL